VAENLKQLSDDALILQHALIKKGHTMNQEQLLGPYLTVATGGKQNRKHNKPNTIDVDIDIDRKTGPTIFQPSSGNLIVNGSFEQEPFKSGLMKKRFWNSQGNVDRSKLAPHTGKYSLQLSSVDENGSDIGISIHIAVIKGQVYRLSAWIKTENIVLRSGRGVKIQIVQKKVKNMAEISGTNAYKLYSTEFKAKSDTVTIYCLMGSHGKVTGKAWFDDLSLIKINN